MFAGKYFVIFIFLMFSSCAYSMNNEQLRQLFVVLNFGAPQLHAGQSDDVQNNSRVPHYEFKRYEAKKEKRSFGKGKFMRNKK